MEKSCIICGVVKPITDYYSHKQMPDGTLNKCKGCAKNQAKARHDELAKDPVWLEAEKTRHREKYYRLNYKEKHKPEYEAKKATMDKYKAKYPEKTLAKNRSAKIKKHTRGNQLHHWSYNLIHAMDIFELSVKHHQKLHRFLVYDQSVYMYRRIDNNELLDTREKHEAYMFDVIANKPD